MQHTTRDTAETAPVESKAQLVDYLAGGCKPADQFRFGTEQERFVYRRPDYTPADYDGSQPGIRALLESMVRFGWEPVRENGLPIALRRGACTITLEPGGQLELSGRPLQDVHQLVQETQTHQAELRALSEELGLSFLALGHQPKHSRGQLPWMPKDRYRIMRAYMSTRGSLGLDMMQSTCALQVTADFQDEADMVKKFRVALALQPLVMVLFANSPFVAGRFSGYLSSRGRVWSDTDPDRCGTLPFVFEEGMGFERYADYVLDVPMYFVIRDGRYIDASGLSFRDFLAGRLPVLPGQRPVLDDWVNHLSTVFPQVRMKRFLEMRGADAGGSLSRVTALAALWAGLLYDTEALDSAWETVRDWTAEEHRGLDSHAPKSGFRTPFRDATLRELCLWMLELSRHGLQRRGYVDPRGQDESGYLDPLLEAARAGRTFAEQLLYRFEHQWRGDMDLAVRSMCEETLS